ncbi:MAG TPA: sulfotransferase [Flavobacteriales bacterium]|nr:sulfotransferase [Flavobacteriales bacterium]
MALPNLFIVGAAKSGTTSLHNYLHQHPDVFMCHPKEPHYLINQEIGINRIPVGITNFIEYIDLFSEGEDKKYRGESSVMYLMYPEIVIPKIKDQFGEDSKIIIMLRNPVERAYSGFQHVKRYNVMESLSFEEALEKSENRYLKNDSVTPASRYLELGNYHKQVKLFLEHFQDVHIILYEDYVKDVNMELLRVFNFLDIENRMIDTVERHMVGGWQWKNKKMKTLLMSNNKLKSLLKIALPSQTLRIFIRKKIMEYTSSKIPKINENTRKYLCKYYEQDIKRLSKLIDRNLNHWTL